MKRSVFLAAFATVLCVSFTARAQTRRPSAAEIASQVQSFYDQTTTVATAFDQSHFDRVYNRTTRSRGVLTIARPGKMRFDYLGGDGKVIVSNGRTVTVYEPGDEGAPGQYTRAPVREGIASALGFLTGQSRIDRDFTFRLANASRFGWSGHVLELRPIRPEPAYRRVYLFVDSSPATAGVVRRVVIQDHAGNTNRFDFRRMRFNRAVELSRFEFSPPRGARRI
jgi:outer membrane lipoprotein carrier protein